MKKFSVAALLICTLISLNACRKVTGKGPIVTETRNTNNFSGIQFEIPGDLFYVPGDEYKIEIMAQQNIIDVIETNVNNNELKLSVRNNTNIRSHEDIRVTITAPSVISLGLAGSGAINVLQPYAPEDLKLRVSGSGKVVINRLETNNIDASISGSGDVQIFEGAANFEDISMSGSGKIDLLGLVAKKAKTQTSGSGDIKINVSEELDSSISGSGTVYYKGTPTISSSISGSGKVAKL